MEGPRDGNIGKFMLRFDIDGSPTAWAKKALNAQAGSSVGKAVGYKAVDSLDSKFTFGGFVSVAAKSKVKETGAVLVVGLHLRYSAAFFRKFSGLLG